jgi:hypothetical protein
MLYLTIVSFVSQYRHLNNVLKVLFLYLITLAIINSLAMYLRLELHIRNNLFLYHILTPLEYILLASIYYRSFRNVAIKKVILWSMYGFVIICILLTQFVEGIQVIDSYARTIEALLVTIWILFYFYQILNTHKVLSLQSDPLFWINVGFLIYFIGNLFIKGLLNTLITQNRDLAKRFYEYGYLLEFNLFIQINIALYCRRIFKDRIKI